MIKNKRAVAPIISIILLLMITLTIVGLAYTWLQRMQGTVQTTSENSSSRTMSGMQASINIDGYDFTCAAGLLSALTLYARNSGTQNANNLEVYIDDVYQAWSTTELAAGAKHNFSSGTTQNCSNFENVSRTVSIIYDEGRVDRSIKFMCTNGNC